jgi:serine/threonine-protein kinase SRPK3
MSNLFPEEQLDSPVGYFPAFPGQTLLNGQWTITRKFGWGPRSSTWLALDTTLPDGAYKAIKIFTVAATEDSSGKNERDLLRGPVKHIASGHGVPEILGDFYEKDANGRRHLCLVLGILGSSVEDLRLSNTYDGEYLPLHIVQKVIGDISKTLASLAKQKIVHGGE